MNENVSRLMDGEVDAQEFDLLCAEMKSPEAMNAFVTHLKAKLRADIPVIEMDTDINDPAFAGATAKALLDMLT